MSTQQLKAPFPWFGGKRPVASTVWQRLGDVRNYIEPFAGSMAVLLLRPHAPKIEAVNDQDCYLANFWRAVQAEPETVARHANWPVNEADLHARHRWLVLSDDAIAFREAMRRDPNHYDPKIAGWWVWGICMWIGGGWCSYGAEQDRRPGWNADGQGYGVHRPTGSQWIEGGTADGDREERTPHLSKPMGVHSKRPQLGGGDNGPRGKGVHGEPTVQIPDLAGDAGAAGRGVHASAGGRPQLADEYSRGRGVHGHDQAETCTARREWLIAWFGRLCDRLRSVRVCCGDWRRVCQSRSVTTRIGLTGVFLDPPYSAAAGRDPNLYAADDLAVADQVRQWCIERGDDPQMRIALCGYEGEHEALAEYGWTPVAWRAQGGYGNRGGENVNRDRERIWFSPHCLNPDTHAGGLFA